MDLNVFYCKSMVKKCMPHKGQEEHYRQMNAGWRRKRTIATTESGGGRQLGSIGILLRHLMRCLDCPTQWDLFHLLPFIQLELQMTISFTLFRYATLRSCDRQVHIKHTVWAV